MLDRQTDGVCSMHKVLHCCMLRMSGRGYVSSPDVTLVISNFTNIIKVFYLPTDSQQSCFKRILKFTLKQLLHVSVQSPSSGSVLFELC